MPVEAPYDAKAIANYFIERSFKEKSLIDPMKLQKLVYFTHGYYLALSKKWGEPKPLVNEFFEAWDYGPVLPTIYREFRDYKSNAIEKPALVYDPDLNINIVAKPPERDPWFNKVANFVWETYSKKHSLGLSDLTHKDGGAWDKARKEAPGLKGKDIPNNYILEDFQEYIS